jgi:hypothetical protein
MHVCLAIDIQRDVKRCAERSRLIEPVFFSSPMRRPGDEEPGDHENTRSLGASRT